MDFGDRLKILRDEHNISRKELATKLNITYSAVSKYETNVRFPDKDTLHKIANYFNVSVDYLLGRTNIKNATSNQLTKKDEKDIAKDLDEIMDKLQNEQGLMFDGEPADEETLNALRDALEMGMRYAKAVNKKYTPKKYRKKDK